MKEWWDTIGTKQKHSIFGGLCVLAVAPWVAQAQDAQDPGGTEVTLDFSQTVESSDNFNLNRTETSGARGLTRLDFGIRSRTRTQSLRLRSTATLQYGNLNDTEDNFSDPNVSLNYTRQGANSRLTTRLNYSQADVTSSYARQVGSANTFFQNFNAFEFVVTEEGKRQNLNGSVGLELGIEGPIGASFRVSQNNITYIDTLDPDLFDSETTSGSAALRFDLNRQLSGQLEGSFSERTTDGNGVDRDSSRVELTLNYGISASLRANASINYTTIDLFGGSATNFIDRTEDGTGFSFGLSQDRRSGVSSVSVSSDVGENGRRTAFNSSHSYILPQAQLTLNFGVSKTEGVGGVDPLIGIEYVRELKRGGVNVSLSQVVSARSDNEEVLSTNLSATYNHELSRLSSIDTSVFLQDFNILGDSTDEDSRRVDLSVSYRRELDKDWDLVGSYTHSRSSRDDRSTITSNTISLGAERSFNWFP